MSGIALKLTFLLVRTIAKPIATAIKSQAKEHEVFRKSCIKIAQTVHSTDLRLRMSLLGEKKIKIRPLNDNKAIENGANWLSETFIFGVAGLLIFYESYRSRKKASDQRDAIADDITILQNEIEYLKTKFRQINVRLDDYVLPEGMTPKYIRLDQIKANNDLERGKDAIEQSLKLHLLEQESLQKTQSGDSKPEPQHINSASAATKSTLGESPP